MHGHWFRPQYRLLRNHLVNIAAPASLPPSDLPGLDPTWSRLVHAPDSRGVNRTWHALDVAPDQPQGTLLCVHGNPTWSYVFRSVAAAARDRWRVIAPDHLGMGYSERVEDHLTLRDRVDELSSLTDALDVQGPVIIVAHDWGGSISLGWAEQHLDMVAGVMLLNTAVSQPHGERAPALIRLARSSPLREALTARTDLFVRATLRQARPPLSSEVAAAYSAPYRSAARRQAIADFVADIPLETTHRTHTTLTGIGAGLDQLRSVPVLLAWGTRDPVFTEPYLRDLQRRLPQAVTHRFENAGHLVIEDAPIAKLVNQFANDCINAVIDIVDEVPPTPPVLIQRRRPLWAAVTEHEEDDTTAIVEMGRTAPKREISWRQLAVTIDHLAKGMNAVGIAPGDRVGLLVPPGADLTAILYATWRAGATAVVADAGLGLGGLRRALRGADVKHVFGETKGLTAARAMGLRATFISVGSTPRPARAALGISYALAELREIGQGRPTIAEPAPSDVAAVLFTSGATGPAKGVVYLHQQLEAQRDAVRTTFAVKESDRLVAAFAPFALFGPALGVPSVVPHMDVTAPATLTARALAAAVASIEATLVFAAPAALRNIVATSGALRRGERNALLGVRMLLSAGAPVPVNVLQSASTLMGGCEAHTPYGMTEALPVSDITLKQIRGSEGGRGVPVGLPVSGVQVAVSSLDSDGDPSGGLTDEAGITGEVCVRGKHVKDHYDQLWATEQESARDVGWHRTGDVGHVDEQGSLWIEGRLAHVVTTAGGPVTPVAIEQRVEGLVDVRLAAVVGVGPQGTQVVVVVVEAPTIHPGLAPLPLLDEVRGVAEVDVAAVLVVRRLPVDIRHNSKIDRIRVALWAEEVLAGRSRVSL